MLIKIKLLIHFSNFDMYMKIETGELFEPSTLEIHKDFS